MIHPLAVVALIATGSVALYQLRRRMLLPSGPAPGAAQPIAEPAPAAAAAELPYQDLPAPAPSNDGLSSKLEGLLSALQSDKRATPDSVKKVAGKFHRAGHHSAGLVLDRNVRAREKSLGGVVYVLKPGDIASQLAKTYTGNALRWPELVGRWSSLGVMSSYRDGNGWMQLKPWRVGQRIILPASWKDPAAKPSGGDAWGYGSKAAQDIVPLLDALDIKGLEQL
jgi:hypothetical protein